MKKIIFLTANLFLTVICFSQDIITKKNGEEIKTKVIEVNQTEIKYKKFDYQTGPSFTIAKSDIFMIKYENGTKDVFNETVEKLNPTNVSAIANDELRMKGKEDALANYKGKSSGAGWTAATTILTSPILGLIPAIACSSSEPSNENLKYPDRELMKKAEYSNAYVEQAHKTKKKKVWKSYGIGAGVWLLVIILLGGV